MGPPVTGPRGAAGGLITRVAQPHRILMTVGYRLSPTTLHRVCTILWMLGTTR